MATAASIACFIRSPSWLPRKSSPSRSELWRIRLAFGGGPVEVPSEGQRAPRQPSKGRSYSGPLVPAASLGEAAGSTGSASMEPSAPLWPRWRADQRSGTTHERVVMCAAGELALRGGSVETIKAVFWYPWPQSGLPRPNRGRGGSMATNRPEAARRAAATRKRRAAGRKAAASRKRRAAARKAAAATPKGQKRLSGIAGGCSWSAPLALRQ